MNYKTKRVAITGMRTGFIADKLANELTKQGAVVYDLDGDIRDSSTFDYLDYTYDYLFHFGAPSSQVLFKRKPEYCIDTTINGFINASRACKQHGIKLVYPSTGLLSGGEVNEYARCKKLCEDMATPDALGLRIFATYGPQEAHKRDYASVPYLFIRDMVKGKRPVIYGDGTQNRDFIYIDDVINSIMVLAEESNEAIVDIGTGKVTSFNEIVDITNKILGTSIKPIYVDKPDKYVDSTIADLTQISNYYLPQISPRVGIANIIKELQDEKSNSDYNNPQPDQGSKKIR